MELEKWKLKRMLKTLDSYTGGGTSMVSLLLRPDDQISKINALLVTELGTAAHIKSRVNKLSVLSAIAGTQQKLKLFSHIPSNGLAIFCGHSTEKKISIALTPFKQLNTSLYMCDNKFHVDALYEMLENDHTYGFVIMDGKGTLFGTVCGSRRDIIEQFDVNLPPKHGRGGQSAPRFARIRTECCYNYITKVCERVTYRFITDNVPNIKGLIIAGAAEFKDKLLNCDRFDGRLKNIVLKVVDVAYGNENGFNQAIDLCKDVFDNVSLIKEKIVISSFFDFIAQNNMNKICFGANETLQALEMGVIETLIIWDDLAIERIVVCDKLTGKETVVLSSKNIEGLDIISREPLSEWLVENHLSAKLCLVSNRTPEGSQFCNGFGGIGGLLRYAIDLNYVEREEEKEYSDNEDDFI